MEGGVRRLTLKNVQLDQAGEVSYQALNAVTNAMLNVKGNDPQRPLGTPRSPRSTRATRSTKLPLSHSKGVRVRRQPNKASGT